MPATQTARPAFSITDRDSLNAAVRLGLVDPMGLVDMLNEHGDRIFDALIVTAEANRHSDNTAMSAWYKIRDAVRVADNFDPAAEDKFGFKAEAIAKASDVLNTHGIRF